MKKNSGIVLVFLFLVIGFAAVSTTLFLNGTVKVEQSDFDVYFTYAKTYKSYRSNSVKPWDDVGTASAVISEDKKSITFTSHILKFLDNGTNLEFRVVNESRNYAANVSFDIEFSDPRIYDYVDIDFVYQVNSKTENTATSFNDTVVMKPTETGFGDLYFILKKAPLEDFEVSMTLNINTSAVEQSYDDYIYEQKGIHVYDKMYLTQTCTDVSELNKVVYNKYKYEIKYGYYEDLEACEEDAEGECKKIISAGETAKEDICVGVYEDEYYEYVDYCPYLNAFYEPAPEDYMELITIKKIVDKGSVSDKDIYYESISDHDILFDTYEECSNMGCTPYTYTVSIDVDDEDNEYIGDTAYQCKNDNIYFDDDGKITTITYNKSLTPEQGNASLKELFENAGYETIESEGGFWDNPAITIPDLDVTCGYYTNGSDTYVECEFLLHDPPGCKPHPPYADLGRSNSYSGRFIPGSCIM